MKQSRPWCPRSRKSSSAGSHRGDAAGGPQQPRGARRPRPRVRSALLLHALGSARATCPGDSPGRPSPGVEVAAAWARGMGSKRSKVTQLKDPEGRDISRSMFDPDGRGPGSYLRQGGSRSRREVSAAHPREWITQLAQSGSRRSRRRRLRARWGGPAGEGPSRPCAPSVPARASGHVAWDVVALPKVRRMDTPPRPIRRYCTRQVVHALPTPASLSELPVPLDQRELFFKRETVKVKQRHGS